MRIYFCIYFGLNIYAIWNSINKYTYEMSLLVLWMKVLPVEILLQLKIEVFDLSASVLPEDFQPPSQVSTGGGGEVGYEGWGGCRCPASLS